MKKKILLVAVGFALAGCCVMCGGGRPTATAISPDGRNEIRLWTNPLAYEVLREGKVLVAKTDIGLKVDGKCLCQAAAEPMVSETKVSGEELSPVYKKAKVDFSRNDTVVDFGSWAVRLAARNDGVAYRFETRMPGKITVGCEKASVTIPCGSATCWVNKTAAIGCEETVNKTTKAADIVTAGDEVVYLPLVYSVQGKTVAVTESDVFDYPIWNLKRANSVDGVAFDSSFAKWPTKFARAVNDAKWKHVEVKEGGRWILAKDLADYLVVTEGTRTFPWRAFVLADAPAKLMEADLVYALARPASKENDFSWVKPGKVAWDWWNDWNLEGVPFKAGCNTRSYEYYIDFAARTGVEYVIFDEGWSETLNIWKFHPEVDVPHLIDYANKKGVGIILWMAWAQVYGNEAKVAEHFSKLGAKGFKVDFMDRGDAEAERFLWKFAEECRKHRMLLDYHGAHRPTGMSRCYPNVLNYEGVHGLEQMKFFGNQDILDNDVKLCYARMTAGPMDYTPGAMQQFPIGKYTGNGHAPGSLGTRSRQIAMMTLFEAPLQMLCDSPTKYERNMECFSFMAGTPVTWADTKGVGGCPDSCAVIARKSKDGAWYAAGITNSKACDLVLDTSFLGEGKWKAEVFRDADDCVSNPAHYVHEMGNSVDAGTKLIYRMAPGGGFVVKFTK